VTSEAARGAPSREAHGLVATVGLVVLAYLALPVASDGLLNTDRFAVVFLAVCGAAVAAVGGLAEGLALRAGYRALAVGCLVAFGVVALFPPGLMSGRWFASQLEPGSSEALGLAMVAWVLTVTMEYLVARAIGRHLLLAEDGDAAGNS
jgi:hypothetical protein